MTYAALEALLLDAGRLEAELQRLRAERDDLEALAHPPPPPPGPWMRTKQRFVAFSERNVVARGILAVWRFVRRR